MAFASLFAAFVVEPSGSFTRRVCYSIATVGTHFKPRMGRPSLAHGVTRGLANAEVSESRQGRQKFPTAHAVGYLRSPLPWLQRASLKNETNAVQIAAVSCNVVSQTQRSTFGLVGGPGSRLLLFKIDRFLLSRNRSNSNPSSRIENMIVCRPGSLTSSHIFPNSPT